MTRVVRIHEFSGPDGLLVDDTEVAGPGPGEVRMDVGAIGLNRAETMIMSGGFGELPLPAPIGYEAAGRIQSVGEGVTGFAVGDRVAILPGLPMNYGGCGETILAPADLLVKTPESQSDMDAAATWMQYLTAYGVKLYQSIGAGDAVLITAASSSVGLAAIQIVNAEGGVPIAVTRTRAKADALRDHGAAHVIVSEEQDVAAAVHKITNGTGVRVAFDAVAGPGLMGVLGSLAQGGTAVIYGGLGGEPSHLSAQLLAFRDLSINGHGAHKFAADPELKEEAIAYIRRGLDSGALKPVIDSTFSLDEIRAAYHRLLGNQQVGKIVVTP